MFVQFHDQWTSTTIGQHWPKVNAEALEAPERADGQQPAGVVGYAATINSIGSWGCADSGR